MATGSQEQLRILDLVQLLIAIQHYQCTSTFGADHTMVEAYIDQPGLFLKITVQFAQRFGVARAEIIQLHAVTQRPAIDHTAKA
ncbi:hypothetical protein D3C81_1861750 [compost metagenome]